MQNGSTKYRVDAKLRVEDFCKVLKIKPTTCNILDRKIKGVTTDSRYVEEADVFFAIKGETHDGNDYVQEAVDKGAAFCVFDRAGIDVPGFKVEDTIKALGEMAKFSRAKFKGKVIAITGSNGKTTTKNITASLLGELGRTSKSQASFNNYIGLPLTILGTPPDGEYMVLEVGTNHSGEIKRLANISKPDIGVVTNVGPVHLEFLGSIDNVAAEKKELLKSLGEEGWAVINADCEKAALLSEGIKARKFFFSTTSNKVDLYVKSQIDKEAGTKLTIQRGKEVFETFLNLAGDHNVANAAAALSVATILGASSEEIAKGLANVRVETKRFEVLKIKDRFTVVNDTYNANPVSVEIAIRGASRMAGNKYLVLGDMLELGGNSSSYHEKIGALAASLNFQGLMLMGEMAGHVKSGALNSSLPKDRVKIYKNHDAVVKEIASIYERSDEKMIVLVKGSRRMRMELIVEKLIAYMGRAK